MIVKAFYMVILQTFFANTSLESSIFLVVILLIVTIIDWSKTTSFFSFYFSDKSERFPISSLSSVQEIGIYLLPKSAKLSKICW